MEAETLLASCWPLSLYMEVMAEGPWVGSMELRVREWRGIGAAAIDGHLQSNQNWIHYTLLTQRQHISKEGGFFKTLVVPRVS